MSQIQAKVTVYHISESKSTDGEKYSETIHAYPVYGTGEENKSYSDTTPSGSISLTITNKSAWGFFKEGREYYVKFDPYLPPVENVAGQTNP